MATISTLSPGKIYAFQVRARTAVGYGPYSGKMYFQTLMGGKCYHFVLRSACDHLSLVCVPECISLSSGGLLPDTPTQLVFLYIIICICRFIHSKKLHAVRVYCLRYRHIPQSYSLLPLRLWPAGAECVSRTLFRRVLQYIALYTAVVWSPAVTGHLTAKCSVKVLKTGGTQDIYPEACLPAVSLSVHAESNILPCDTLWSGSKVLIMSPTS